MSYTLHYFPLRARGEAAKMMCHMAGVPLQLDVLDFAQFGERKAEISHFGQLPSLTANGKLISQSGAINRYLAHVCDLVPKDANLAADQDMMMELAQVCNVYGQQRAHSSHGH